MKAKRQIVDVGLPLKREAQRNFPSPDPRIEPLPCLSWFF